MFCTLNLIRNKCRQSPLLNCQRFYRYYLLLPEIPACTAESNDLLKSVENGEFPPIKSVSLEMAIEATAKLALEFECLTSAHSNTFKDARIERTFETVLEPLNAPNVMLDAAWGTLRQKMLTEGGSTAAEWIDMRIKHKGMNRLVIRTRCNQFNKEYLHRAVKEVAADKNQLDQWKSRLCQIFLTEGKLSCIDYKKHLDKQKVDEYSKKETREGYSFWLNVKQSSIQPDNMIESNDLDLPGTPPNLLSRWSTNRKGLFMIPLDETSYLSTLTYCRNRMKRFKMWEYWNSRAAFDETSPLVNNALNVTELRETRHEYSKLIGFKTYAEKSLMTKMAYSLEELEKFLGLLREKCASKFQRRLKEMQTYAERMDTVSGPLKPWDYFYYARKLAEKETKFNANEFSKCFSFPETWNNLLKLAERLFNVRFVDVTSERKSETMHQSVSVYCVVDKQSGEEKGYLFVDAYARKGKNASTWTDCCRTRDKTLNYLPIVYLNTDVIFNENNEQLLSFEQLILIVRSFGTSLVNLLCEAPYFTIYGLNNVEIDGCNVFGDVMKWIVLEPTVLHALSGQKLSVTKAENARRFYVEQILPRLLRETFLSEFDLTIHHTTAYWFDIWRQMHKNYYFKPTERGDHYPCSFSAIMTDGNAAAYYSSLWSNMVACDVVSAFKEAGFENETALAAVGKRYRDTYLTLGGGRHARDVFKLFRNRDLEFDHMIKFYDLE